MFQYIPFFFYEFVLFITCPLELTRLQSNQTKSDQIKLLWRLNIITEDNLLMFVKYRNSKGWGIVGAVKFLMDYREMDGLKWAYFLCLTTLYKNTLGDFLQDQQ